MRDDQDQRENQGNKTADQQSDQTDSPMLLSVEFAHSGQEIVAISLWITFSQHQA